jgi:hypothetical protein
MYLLYLDESGNESGQDRYFVLGGLALFERQTYHLSASLDALQGEFFPGERVPIHITDIKSGSKRWRKLSRDRRQEFIQRLARMVMDSPHRGRKFFAVAVEKTPSISGDRAVELATEEMCRRFDLYLSHRAPDQRGLIIFAEGRFHQRAKLWVSGFRELGTRWGSVRNLADIPYFASMKLGSSKRPTSLHTPCGFSTSTETRPC